MKNKNVIKTQDILPDLINEFEQFIPKDAKSKVINYSGVEGLKQVTINSLKAKGEIRIFEIENMGSFLNFGFCEEIRTEFIKRKIKVKELSNQKNQKPWTEVSKFVKYNWDCRYIDPKILEAKVELLIYNEVTAIYSYKNNQIFCVEIYNKNLAETQKQIFDFMWHYAQKLRIKEGGATELW